MLGEDKRPVKPKNKSRLLCDEDYSVGVLSIAGDHESAAVRPQWSKAPRLEVLRGLRFPRELLALLPPVRTTSSLPGHSTPRARFFFADGPRGRLIKQHQFAAN